MRIVKSLLLTSIAVILLSSCTDQISRACIIKPVKIDVTVLEPNGTKADSVNIVVTRKLNGEKFNLCSEDESYCDNGHRIGDYIIMHDGLFDEISPIKEPAIVVGTKGDLSFSEDFVFNRGECHVGKIAGPDTVSLSAN